MVGGLFFHNYCSGTGLMSGATFGRLAGRNAAQWAAQTRSGAHA
jgi:tricarballylate dehydrogenase